MKKDNLPVKGILMMRSLFEIGLLLLCMSIPVSAEFTSSARCVDLNGKTINCPESDVGFTTSVITMEALDETSVSTYSSNYSSLAFTATEETISNLNLIGDKVGVHWIARPLVRKSEEISLPTVSTSKTWLIKTKWFSIDMPSIEIKEVQPAIKINTTVSFQWALRNAVSDINTFNPKTGHEGIEMLGSLSDNPALRKIINIYPAGVQYTSLNCIASAYVLMGNGDNDPWNKPLIVADGFDPRCRIGIQEIMQDIPYSLTPFASQFMSMATGQGYDVIFVDFKDGGADIVENSKILLKVIEEVCSRANGPVAAGGYSMGGLIARVALLIGQKNNVPNLGKIKKYLSIDSPHLGAQVNLDMQKKIVDISDAKVWEPADYLFKEAVYTIAFDLKCKAARQMCITHAVASEYTQFYSFIKGLGNYPVNMKKIAIADACWKWPYPGANLNGTAAAIINGTTMYMRNEDLFPGAYIDLWASSRDFHVDGLVFAGLTGLPGLVNESFGFDSYTPSSSLYGDTRYKPTHMPLYSSFGIEKSDFLAIPDPQNQADLDRIAKQYTAFDKILMIDFDNRYRHIQFDNQMANTALFALKNPDITPILQLLLSD